MCGGIPSNRDDRNSYCHDYLPAQQCVAATFSTGILPNPTGAGTLTTARVARKFVDVAKLSTVGGVIRLTLENRHLPDL
jgi:hypothetical protein